MEVGRKCVQDGATFGRCGASGDPVAGSRLHDMTATALQVCDFQPFGSFDWMRRAEIDDDEERAFDRGLKCCFHTEFIMLYVYLVQDNEDPILILRWVGKLL